MRDDRGPSALDALRCDACGVDRDGRVVRALVHRSAYDRESGQMSVLVLGDLSGRTAPEVVTDAVSGAVAQLGGEPGSIPAISIVPAPRTSAADGAPRSPFPPEDGFFDHAADPLARYLWRWAGNLAPDLVIELRGGGATDWRASDHETAGRLGAGSTTLASDSFLGALGAGAGDSPGRVPGIRISAPGEQLAAEFRRLLAVLGNRVAIPSDAHRNLLARRNRSPTDVARLLTSIYGYTLDPVVYTQGVSISGRLVAWEDGVTSTDPTENIRELADSLLSDPSSLLSSGPDGAALAGLTWACDLARIGGDARARTLFLAAADYYEEGAGLAPPRPADFDFRVEDMYFTATVLGQAHLLSGKTRYRDLLEKYLRNCLQSGVQRTDGLFDHSQRARYPWGRGNGFAALGYAEALTHLPGGATVRPDLLAAHRKHLRAALANAAPSGKQRQITDFPGSYEELSATCMVGIALARGTRLGWLDESYAPGLERCWLAAAEAVGDDGGLVDVCVGTGPQASARDYLDRPAASGFDDRGGAMAMWFALEMAKLSRADRSPTGR